MGRPDGFSRQTQADEDFTRAAWDSVMDTQGEYGTWVEVVLLPSAQRGVWIVRLTARRSEQGQPDRVMSSYQGSYPNSSASTLSTYLYRAANCLGQMVEATCAEDVRKALDRGRPRR